MPKCPYCRKDVWDGPFQLGMYGQKGADGRPTSKIDGGKRAFAMFNTWSCAACGHVRMARAAPAH